MNVRIGDRVRAIETWPYQDGFAIKGPGTVTARNAIGDYAFVRWDDDPERVGRPLHILLLVVETGLDVMLDLI